jgi:tetratricopeptide (TPR) repeat protein
LFEQSVILCGLVLLSLLAGSWLWWRRQRDDSRSRLMFVFVLWFFITVSTSSGLVPLPDLMADHRSYLPSIGIFVLIACLLDWVRKSSWRHAQILASGLLTVWVAALAWSTCLRNEVWRTRESLWEDTVAKSPNKYRTWGNLGAAYSEGGKEEKAVECYKAALKIEPRFQNGLLNLSNSLLRLNRPKESLENTVKMIQMDNTAGSKPPVAFTLGLGLASVGRYDEAVSVFRGILAVMPHDLQARKALGLVYYQAGLPHRALDHYHEAAAIHPHDEHLQMLIKAAENAQVQKGGRF